MEEERDIGMGGIRVREEERGDRRNGEIVERQGSEGVRSRRKVKILEREGFEKKGKRNVLRKEGGASS